MISIKGAGGGGEKVTVDGVKPAEGLALETTYAHVNLDVTVPYFNRGSSAVVLNDEIHLMGGGTSDDTTCSRYHYKWDGSKWTSVSELPYRFYEGVAAVLNGEIYILGSSYFTSGTSGYRWDGNSWKSIGAPYAPMGGCAVTLNEEIHVLGAENGNYDRYHYKWNGNSWTSVGTLPFELYNGCAVVLNNEIHILGGPYGSSQNNHYKWDGASWTQIGTLPKSVSGDIAVVRGDEIYLTVDGQYIYKWDGASWIELEKRVYLYQDITCKEVVLGNEIVFFGGKDGDIFQYLHSEFYEKAA